MIHECNLNCQTVDIASLENLGIPDRGKWLPFIFNLSIVEAAKMTTDEDDHELFNCTTVFTKYGEAYIIDTPYMRFFELFKSYNEEDIDDGQNDDLEL